jgi:chromosome partitioning protein
MANRIISFVNVKGGSGKSTVACCLAGELLSQGRSVSLIDADPQGGASAWHGAGDQFSEIPLIVDTSGAVGAKAEAQEGVVLIDVAGFATDNMISALSASDLAVIPCRASALDAIKAVQTQEYINQVGQSRGSSLSSVVVMNGVTRTAIAPHIRAEIEGAGLKVAKTELGQRTAFALAGLNGSAPCFMGASAAAAADEVSRLIKELKIKG